MANLLVEQQAMICMSSALVIRAGEVGDGGGQVAPGITATHVAHRTSRRQPHAAPVRVDPDITH